MKKKIFLSLTVILLAGFGAFTTENVQANSSNIIELEVFTVGGIDVTNLQGLEVDDPVKDPGATLEVESFSEFAGVIIKATPIFEILNPYSSVNWDTFQQFKANLHTHTDYSDGTKPPHERIDEYHENNYSILSLTDHDDYNPEGPINYPWTELNNINEDWENRDPDDLGMIAVQGLEISAGIHLGSHFNDFVGEASSDEEYVLSQIQERDGLAQFFHPGRYTNNNPHNMVEWYADKYLKFDCLVGMEVYNGRDIYPRDRELWDNVLMQTLPEKVIWAFANDDTHVSSIYIDFLFSWNMFILEELSLEDVKEAYANGIFFACNRNTSMAPDPPVINRIILENDSLTIDGSGYDSIDWIADGNNIGIGETIELKDIKKNNMYVRGKLTKHDGLSRSRTLTQPFTFVEVETDIIKKVYLNGNIIAEESLEAKEIKADDELLVTITCADTGASKHYKLKTINIPGPELLPGDVNGDGTIDVFDVTLAMRQALELIELDPEQKIAADVNNDGVIDVSDVVLIMRYALGLIDSFL